MDSETRSYYEWYNKAERAGTLDRALVEYYRDSPYLYTARVDGETHALPILTRPEWMHPDISLNSALGEYDSTVFSDFDMDVVERLVDRVAVGAEDDSPAVGDYLFNGPAIQPLSLHAGKPDIDVQESDYFTKLVTDSRLSNELGRHLYESGVSPVPSQETLADVMDSAHLPTREKYGSDLETVTQNLSTRTAPFGVNAMLVVNTGDEYRLFIAKRSEDLIVYPGTWSITPAGGLEPIEGTIDCTANLLKEYGEEILGVEEHTDDALDHAGVRQLNTLLEDGRAHLDFLGIGVPANRLGIILSTVLLIDDPDYYDQYIRGQDLTNAEVSDFRFISLEDTEELKSLLDPEQFLQEGTMILLEGLRRLEHQHGIGCGLSITQTRP